MNLLFSLVRKDFILAKKYLLIMFIFAVVLPIFIQYKVNEIYNARFISFFITALYVQFMLFNTVSMQEDKFKGAIYLSATPFTRNALVKSKYLFLLLLFLISTVIYMATSMIMPFKMHMPGISTIGISLFIITIFFGILIPVQYRFGYEKTKYIGAGYIIVSIYLFPFGIKFLQTHNMSLQGTLPLENLLPFFLSLVIGIASMRISTHIYSIKDL